MLKVNIDKIKVGEDVLVVDKPEGWTSHDVVAKIRGELSKKHGKKVKVGHGGTLDPFATGALVILVGKATKRFDEIGKMEKEYVMKVRLGKMTDSLDKTGKLVREKEVREVSKRELNKVLKGFVGEYGQTVPFYSAARVNGKRLYQLARKGERVRLPKKAVRIKEVELLDMAKDWFKIRVVCGGGAYMRQLAVDMAKKTGNLAYVEELRRVRVGDLKDYLIFNLTEGLMEAQR